MVAAIPIVSHVNQLALHFVYRAVIKPNFLINKPQCELTCSDPLLTDGLNCVTSCPSTKLLIGKECKDSCPTLTPYYHQGTCLVDCPSGFMKGTSLPLSCIVTLTCKTNEEIFNNKCSIKCDTEYYRDAKTESCL